jgi:chemotaxis methyl-accepting protein methylase
LPRGYEIYGFDLNGERIAQAQRAVYGENSLRGVEEEQKRDHFARTSDQLYELKPAYRRHVKFAEGNLVGDAPFQEHTFDVVFCRNVLLYLSPGGVDRALNTIARAMRPEGYLFVGHAESLLGRHGQFDPDTLGDSVVYRRVADS